MATAKTKKRRNIILISLLTSAMLGINFHGEEIQKGTNIRFYIYKNFKFPKSEKMKIQKLKTKESESKNRLSETTTF